MKIRSFSIPKGLGAKQIQAAEKLNRLIEAANQHEIPVELVDDFEQKLSALENETHNPEIKASSISKLTQYMMDSLRTRAGLVTKDYYRNFWMSVGMAVFGIPFGVAFSSVLKNYAFIGIGLPIGLSIGIAIGTSKDKQVISEGRQLNF